MIEIGYTTLDGDDTVTGSYNSPVDANAAIEALNITLRPRDDGCIINNLSFALVVPT